MAQDFAKQENVMILTLVFVNGSNYSVDLINDNSLQAILLVEVSVQELLHRLSILVVLVRALVVMLFFFGVNINNDLFKLFKSVVDLPTASFQQLEVEVANEGAETFAHCQVRTCLFALLRGYHTGTNIRLHG